MSSKFVTAPNAISNMEGALAQYGIQADIGEIGMAVMAGLVIFGLARSVLTAN